MKSGPLYLLIFEKYHPCLIISFLWENYECGVLSLYVVSHTELPLVVGTPGEEFSVSGCQKVRTHGPKE